MYVYADIRAYTCVAAIFNKVPNLYDMNENHIMSTHNL